MHGDASLEKKNVSTKTTQMQKESLGRLGKKQQQ